MRRLLLLTLLTAHATACAPAAKPQKSTTSTAPAPPPAATPAPARDAADLEARLAHLATVLEQERERQHIPGMAVAVVRGDRVIFSRSFGVRDLTTQEPVTPETLFAIGSQTKAFTATAAGMVIDEGKLSWDDPLSRHLPALALQVKAMPGEQASLRDALCHRTGFPDMGVLWASGKLGRDEVYQHASRAQPTEPLGEEFQYNNVLYSAAGDASARAAGTSWEELVRTRVLGPLGMQRTYVSAREAEQTGALAAGYTWDPDLKRHLRENLRDTTAVAPAGSIHSNLVDMTAWLRFQLGRGVFGGKRLIREATLAQTHEVQIPIHGHGGYGLGWFVHDWNGRRYIEHGGNIDGFAANVGFLPEADLGFVFLSNTTVSVLQSQVGPLVFEAMFGDAHRPNNQETNQAAGEDFAPYLGVYLASFGPYQEAPFKVFLKEGKLAVDVPQLGVFELTPPDDKGRRQFKTAPDVGVSFGREDGGQIEAMYVHQYGFDFELPRQGLESRLHVDPAAVAPYVGKYQESQTPDKTVVTVLIHRGRLAVDVPGQTQFALDPPAEPGDDKWRLRMRRELYVTFDIDRGASGKVASLTIHQGGNAVTYARLPDAGKEAAVTLDSIVARRRPEQRKRAFAAMRHAVMEGKVRFPNAGIEGTFTVHFEGLDRYRHEVDLGKAGRMIQVVNGANAWVAGDFDQAEQLDGVRALQARIQHPLAFAGDWRELFGTVELLGAETVDGKLLHVVSLRAGELPVWRAYVDPATGDVVKATGSEIQSIGNVPAATSFADFREVRGGAGTRGLRLPFQTTTEIFRSGNMIVTLDRIRTGLRPDPTLYPSEVPAARNAGAPAAAPGDTP